MGKVGGQLRALAQVAGQLGVRGLAFMRASDAVISEIESRHALRIGPPAYAQLKHHLRAITSPEGEE